MSFTRTLAAATLTAATIGGSFAYAYGATTAPVVHVAGQDTGHGRPDIPAWVIRPCGGHRVVNCRVEGRHPHSIRELPGSARMVCVFYAQPRIAAHRDYCEVTR